MPNMRLVELEEAIVIGGDIKGVEFDLFDEGGHKLHVHIIVTTAVTNGIAEGDPDTVMCAMMLGITGGEQADEILAAVTGT